MVLSATLQVDYDELKNRIVPQFFLNTVLGDADNIYYRVAYDDANRRILFRDGYRDADALLEHVQKDVLEQLVEAGPRLRSPPSLWFVGPREQRSRVLVGPLINSTYWNLDSGRSVILNPYPDGTRPMRGKWNYNTSTDLNLYLFQIVALTWWSPLN